VILDRVDSTMAEAARLAPTLACPTWIMAREQTAARGRRGKVWQQPAGNLAATLIYKPDVTAPEAAKRSFMAAIALYETLAIYIDRTMLSLKWPNDVLLNGGKVAGILLESAGRGPFIDWLSVGVGVNLTTIPHGLTNAFPPVSLRGEGGESVTPEDFLTVLAGNYATQEAKLATFGFARIREDWLRHAARVGEVITARTGKDMVKGIFDTVDEDGNLVLITGMGPRAIPAADVFF
jgi:BirA family transcriptional regulator, biotin operon repressor / biotin---[acetyl-CoA-carboxylase] ligase